MVTLIIFLGILTAGFLATFSVVTWLLKAMPRSRTVLTLLLSCLASYALGFFVDMSLQTLLGDLQPSASVAPLFTWFSISLFCWQLARQIKPTTWPLVAPFLANALLAALAGFSATASHFDFPVAIILFAVGMLQIPQFWFARPSLPKVDARFKQNPMPLDEALTFLMHDSQNQLEEDGAKLKALVSKIAAEVGSPVIQQTKTRGTYLHPALMNELQKPGNERLLEIAKHW